MKCTFIFLSFAMLILSACAPMSEPTSVPPTSVALLPTDTPAPTATFTATPLPTAMPTLTPTPIPTIQVGDLSVPDPRVTNPELFDLSNPDAPISQFISAMQMAGIEVRGKQVAQGLTFQELKDKDGNPFVVAVYSLDPDTNQKGETLEGPIPLMIAQNEEGEWGWKKDNVVPLRSLADPLGLTIANLESHYDRVGTPVLKIFNGLHITWYQKWDLVEPTQSNEQFTKLDYYVKLAEDNNMEPIGGPIIYFYELPNWLKENNLSDQGLELATRNRARSLVERYKGRINVWTVVNEYHATPYEPDYLYTRLGQKYVEIAFEEARRADSKAILIYNDNANETPNGHWYRQTYNLVKQLKQKGVIDAVGMQMHLNQPGWTGVPSQQELAAAIRSFRQLGLEVYITEMDVGVNERIGPKDRFFYQAEVYKQILDIYLRETKGQKYQIVALFGYADRHSWYDEVLHYPDVDPLLFDDSLNPKLSYYAILQLLCQLNLQ